MQDDAWLSIAEVSRRVTLSRATIYRHITAGTFPAPTQLGPNTVRWRASEVAAWEQSRPLAGCAPAVKGERAA